MIDWNNITDVYEDVFFRGKSVIALWVHMEGYQDDYPVRMPFFTLFVYNEKPLP